MTDIDKVLKQKREWSKTQHVDRRQKDGSPADRKVLADCLRAGRQRATDRPLPWWKQLMRTILPIILIIVCHTAHADQGKIVEIARSQIGKGEIGGDNKGPEVEEYTKGKNIPWCAAFVSWVLVHTGEAKHGYLLSAKSYWKAYKAQRTASPRSGDIILFYRGSPKGPLGHVGIIENVRGNRITTIEGNVGKYPAKVKEFHYTLGHIPHLLGFVRIQ